VLTYGGIYDLCGYGVVLGMLGAMESLMSSSALEGLSDTRADSNRELVGQGLGNLTAALFGSIASAGSIIRSHANVRAGGRGRLSGALCSAVMLFSVWAIAPLIGKIPLSIFAGLIISVGLTLFDWSILRFLKFYRPPFGLQQDVLIGFLVHACVVVVTVAVSVTSAVLVGIVLSTAYFIVKMGMTGIRRRYSGGEITSKRIRNSAQSRYLQENGQTIRVFELQGPVFFGSADRLSRAIESDLGEASFCILDMHHVSDIDATGAAILLRLYKRLAKSGRTLLISHLKDGESRQALLTAAGVLEQIDARHLFPDTDAALEWAEERILADRCLLDTGKRYRMQEIDVLQGLSNEELTIFERFLDRREFKKSDAIISEGRNDRDLLILTHGLVRVSLHLAGSNRQRRLFTLGAGTIIGEMALLDGSPRSADVWAEEDSEFYRLTFDGYQKICADHPQIALKLVANIALVISQRLRVRSQEVRMLADN
ncbi:MAG: SulP family inorganic anion transporter, partial [Desulfobacterales bacterium]